jgi:hypothetical protein
MFVVAPNACQRRVESLQMPFAALICQPEEMEMLQRVYKSILRTEWFDRTENNERVFARLIIDLFQRGMMDEERLFTEANSIARARLSTFPTALE